MPDWKSYKRYGAPLFLAVPVLLIAYGLKRENFLPFILLYFLSFAGFLYLNHQAAVKDDDKFYIRVSIFLRILLLFALPGLSNDFYRFIWDGRMILLGYNPYLVLPADFYSNELLAQVGKDSQELYVGMGFLSPFNYTCYPPLNQLFFFIPAGIFSQNIYLNVLVMRIFIIGGDIGVIYWGRKILRKLQMPTTRILLYALNPFILLELTANIHFEGVMIFFLLWAFWLILQQKQTLSAIALALSVSVKLIPLLFLPLLLKKLGQRGIVKYGIIVLLVSIALFLPFFSIGLVENFMSSIDLYFRKFEFNASIYYIIRWIGYQTYGWNIIQKVGPLLGLVVFVFVLMMAVIRKNQEIKTLLVSMLFAVSGYYFLSTTVHPWYLALPLIISIFTPYRFVVVWTGTIMLSYFAYSLPVFQEKMIILTFEYGIVFGFLVGELINKSKPIKAYKVHGK